MEFEQKIYLKTQKTWIFSKSRCLSEEKRVLRFWKSSITKSFIFY